MKLADLKPGMAVRYRTWKLQNDPAAEPVRIDEIVEVVGRSTGLITVRRTTIHPHFGLQTFTQGVQVSTLSPVT